jgi:hypothetical protein
MISKIAPLPKFSVVLDFAMQPARPSIFTVRGLVRGMVRGGIGLARSEIVSTRIFPKISFD